MTSDAFPLGPVDIAIVGAGAIGALLAVVMQDADVPSTHFAASLCHRIQPCDRLAGWSRAFMAKNAMIREASSP